MNAPVQPATAGPIGELFSEHGDFVFRTLQYLGVPGPSLDDGLQDVFVTAYRRWGTFEGRSAPRTWLYGIARRVAFRYRRKDENHRRRFVLTERIVEGVDAPFEQAHARRSVQALLEGLDEDKRAAFVLVEVEGFTAAEAAELLEIPLGTVYSRVRAAWGRLRDAARQDVHVSSMQVEMESERRVGLQRALMAACLPASAGAVGTATTGLGAMGWVWAVAAAGVLAVGIGVAADSGPPEPAPVVEQPETRAPAGVAELKPVPVAPAVAPPSPVSPEPQAHAALESIGAVDPEPGVATPKPEVATPIRTQSPRGKPAAEGTNAEPPPSRLVEELALIRKAKELVRDGKPDEAEKVLDEHARAFADGQLSDERREVRRSLASSAQDAAAP
ncbi:MAG: RNA polymerase sigma factor [Nannocystales bacterium]